MLGLAVAKLIALLKAHAFGAVERRGLAAEVGFRGGNKPSVVACKVRDDILYRPVACCARLGHALGTHCRHQSIPLAPRRAQFSQQARLGHVLVHTQCLRASAKAAVSPRPIYVLPTT